MHSRLRAFGQAFRASRLWDRTRGPALRPRLAHFICQACRYKSATPSVFRNITQQTQRNFATVSKNTKEKSGHYTCAFNSRRLTRKEYPKELLIYDAGDTRTTFVAFWKAFALLQCGTCIILITPKLYKNENQPNEYIRTAQAIGGKSRFLPISSRTLVLQALLVVSSITEVFTSSPVLFSLSTLIRTLQSPFHYLFLNPFPSHLQANSLSTNTFHPATTTSKLYQNPPTHLQQ
jgi:hypothetical protein